MLETIEIPQNMVASGPLVTGSPFLGSAVYTNLPIQQCAILVQRLGSVEINEIFRLNPCKHLMNINNGDL